MLDLLWGWLGGFAPLVRARGVVPPGHVDFAVDGVILDWDAYPVFDPTGRSRERIRSGKVECVGNSGGYVRPLVCAVLGHSCFACSRVSRLSISIRLEASTMVRELSQSETLPERSRIVAPSALNSAFIRRVE